MPTIKELSDVAIALEQAFVHLGIDFGIFGGYAISTLGGTRTSKDIDCAVGCSKTALLERLSSFPTLRFTGNTREDVAIFVVGGVSIDFFPIAFEKLTTAKLIVGGTKTSGTTRILDPALIFKGKLQAAATRSKHTDAADLVFLEGKYRDFLKNRSEEFDAQLAGMALKRYPYLEHSFNRVGIDVESCKAHVKHLDIEIPTPVGANSVQNGLLYGL